MTDFNKKDEKKDVKEEETKVPKDAYGNHDPDKAAPGGFNLAPSVGPVPGVGEEKDKEDAEKDKSDHIEKNEKGPVVDQKIMPGQKDQLFDSNVEPDKKFQPEDKKNDPTLPQDASVKKPKNPKF